MAKTKDIQRRIKSISSTKRITRAMEMVEASKMRKAVEAALATRTYANLSWETLMNIVRSSQGNFSHPLLEVRSETKRQALILITANRGLCGGFNTAIIAEARKMVKGFEDTTDLILLGKKGESLSGTLKVSAQFTKEEAVVDTSVVSPIAKLIIKDYLNQKYDRILIAYTDFINAAKQKPRVKQLLPLTVRVSDEAPGVAYQYTFEPNPQVVLDQIVPRLVEIQLFQALLESTASEHSARMAAMHQATKAASDLVDELTLFYNKARQASITAEIAEITAGVAALE